MAVTQYMTVAGDRWDTVAFKAYGDCTQDQMNTLKAANPYETAKEEFAAGILLNVPVLEVDSTDITSLLPPWKRNQAT